MHIKSLIAIPTICYGVLSVAAAIWVWKTLEPVVAEFVKALG
jgi:hypothetical protein